MEQIPTNPDHRLRNTAIVATAVSLGLLVIGTIDAASTGPDQILPNGIAFLAIGMLAGIVAVLAWIGVAVIALNRFMEERRVLYRTVVWLVFLTIAVVSIGLVAAFAARHRGLGARAVFARDAPRVISTAFGLDEDCQLNDQAWHWGGPQLPTDPNGAHGMSADFGRTADPNGIIFSCGQGTRAQPCYLLEPRYYACYLPDPGDVRYGQWACVFAEDGKTFRLDRYRDFWNATPCRTAMEKAGFKRGWNGNWWLR